MRQTCARTLVLPAALVLLGALSSTPAWSQSGDCAPFDSTWQAIQKVIFEQKGCTQSACHGLARQGGLDLRPEAAYQNLVGAYSEVGRELRVQAGSSQDSFLYRKLAAATQGLDLSGQGSPMPLGLQALSAHELEAIRLWIQYGAPETGVIEGTQTHLNACLPQAAPPRIAAPDPPLLGAGVQLHAPPWPIAPGDEDEVCYATYFDLEAGGDGHPLSGSKLTIKTKGKAKRQSVKFTGRWSGDGAAVPDPTVLGATLRLAGEIGQGDSGAIALPADGWRKRGRAFVYGDGDGSHGGIRSVVLTARKKDGRLAVAGGGANWKFSLEKPATRLGFTLTVDMTNWCTRFEQGIAQRATKRLIAAERNAPASCSFIPPEARIPCPDYWGGPSQTCYYFNRTDLTQEPNSHHSIIHLYRGDFAPTDRGFGFRCFGGPTDGQACDPRVSGVCGRAGICHGEVKSSIACINYGPPDYSRGFSVTGTGSDNAPAVGGSQQPFFRNDLPGGVFGIFPARAVVVWNSHAFNLTPQATANQQWWNIFFAGETDRTYPARGIFDATDIFIQDVPPFQEREYCRTITLGQGTRLYQLSSHTHKRGRLYRVWGPGIAASCRSTSENPGLCTAEPGDPILVTTVYNDPAVVRIDPPLALDDPDPATRRFKFCAIYDNGSGNAELVKRNSMSPLPPQFGALAPGGPCYIAGSFARDRGVACLGGPHKGEPCGGDDRQCDSAAGANDGKCDACPLVGGVTTEDEMFILLGGYYCVPGTPCEAGPTP